MIESFKKLLEERLLYLQEEIVPKKVVDWIKCLQKSDRELIACTEQQKGEIRAVNILFDRLKRRDDEGYFQLVRACRKSGQQHAAMLLDPRCKIPSGSEMEDFSDENEKLLTIVGTASEARVYMRIMNRDKKYFTKGSDILLQKLNNNKCDEALELRNKFDKHLPQGVAFVILFKAKDSIGCKLRISQKTAADELLTMYSNGELKDTLEELLIDGYLREDAEEEELSLHVTLMEEEVVAARENLTVSLEGYESLRMLAVETDIDEITRRLKNIKIPEVRLIKDNQSCMKLTLNEYQNELAKPALEGTNCIICAPTNSGKTYVALYVALNHLNERMKKINLPSQPRPKVLFIVHRVNLVLQQRMRFDSYLSDKYQIADISGANLSERKMLTALLEDNDVIVLTAQILVDALKEGRCSITDFSLLIFDECHHTQKGHPYNDIMSAYLAVKFKPLDPTGTLPQIVGLTASLGAGKSETVAEAKTHIISLCANLDTPVIVTVQQHADELKKRVGTTKCEKHEIFLSEEDYFDRIMNETMNTIEDMLKGLPFFEESITPAVKGGQQYGQWALEVEKRGVAIGSRDLVVIARHLKTYNTALTVKKICRVKDANKCLEDFFDSVDKRKSTAIDEKLLSVYEEFKVQLKKNTEKLGEIKNPYLEEIEDILLKEHDDAAKRKAELKGILYSTTRDSTEALKSWLQESETLKAIIKPEKLVGTGNNNGNGMTQKSQEEVIRNFKSGHLNLLISTSVGEEGIDIPNCTFAIRYGIKSNEISAVQARGRVRAKEGRLYIVAGSDSGVIERESINSHREKLMLEATNEVKNMKEEDLKEWIENLQKEFIGNRIKKEKAKAKPKRDAILSCRECQVEVCNLADIRKIREAHHVILKPGFSSLVRVKKHKSKALNDEIEFTGQIFCKGCQYEWGVLLRYNKQPWYCIKASSFGFLFSGDSERQTFKKWKQCKAHVQDLKPCDLDSQAVKSDAQKN